MQDNRLAVSWEFWAFLSSTLLKVTPSSSCLSWNHFTITFTCSLSSKALTILANRLQWNQELQIKLLWLKSTQVLCSLLITHRRPHSPTVPITHRNWPQPKWVSVFQADNHSLAALLLVVPKWCSVNHTCIKKKMSGCLWTMMPRAGFLAFWKDVKWRKGELQTSSTIWTFSKFSEQWFFLL